MFYAPLSHKVTFPLAQTTLAQAPSLSSVLKIAATPWHALSLPHNQSNAPTFSFDEDEDDEDDANYEI